MVLGLVHLGIVRGAMNSIYRPSGDCVEGDRGCVYRDCRTVVSFDARTVILELGGAEIGEIEETFVAGESGSKIDGLMFADT